MKNGVILEQFSPTRILLPVLLGLVIVAYALYGEFTRHGAAMGEMLVRLTGTPRSLAWLVVAVLAWILRDLGYVWQFRILTGRRLPWPACLQVVLLWNFFAAVSPSVVGGAAVAVFMLVKEKLSIGRATAIVFTTVFLDQVFYTSVPFFASLFVPQSDIFAPLHRMRWEALGTSMMAGFWAAWGGLVVYVVLLVAALFVAPGWINQLLTRVFLLHGLRRWRSRGLHIVNDLLTASRDLRARNTIFWLEVWAATSLAWAGQYCVLNSIVEAFSPTPMSFAEHWLVVGRQAVLWIVMVLSPTPGSAGVAELGVSWLLADLVPPGSALAMAILWRLITYYPHLVIGALIMGRWIRRVYGGDIRDPLPEHE